MERRSDGLSTRRPRLSRGRAQCWHPAFGGLEIGIRVALGANSRRIVRSVFARASAQLGTGVAVGMILALALERRTNGMVMGGPSTNGAGLRGAIVVMPIVAAIALGVGLLAAIVPARRGLAVQPIEALRGE